MKLLRFIGKLCTLILSFSLNCTFLLPLFPGAIVELENFVLWLFLKNAMKIQTVSGVIWITEGNINI